jgi:hypothetical protein
LTWIFPKKFFWCFFNSPCWETHKNAIKKTHKKNKKRGSYLPTPFSGHLPDIRRFELWFFFLWRPLRSKYR